MKCIWSWVCNLTLLCFKDSAIIKQEVKPNIKKEHFNGSIDGYHVQAAAPFNNIYPHPAYYARGGLPPTGQPSAPDPVNRYHHNLPAMHNGYYNYRPNALFPPKLRTYEGRHSSLPKTGSSADQVDKKPDIQSLQARLAQSYPSYPALPFSAHHTLTVSREDIVSNPFSPHFNIL